MTTVLRVPYLYMSQDGIQQFWLCKIKHMLNSQNVQINAHSLIQAFFTVCNVKHQVFEATGAH